MTSRPPPKVNVWADTEPAEERAARMLAWQEYRCCRDCTHWLFDDEDDDGEGCIGCCGHPFWHGKASAFQVPEDYTCSDFEAKKGDAA
jgi:hypothetical protein